MQFQVMMLKMPHGSSTLSWSATGADPHFLALLVKAHSATWFSIEGFKRVVRYAQGVPAGTSLADLVFCAGCSRVTTFLTDELVKENLLF